MPVPAAGALDKQKNIVSHPEKLRNSFVGWVVQIVKPDLCVREKFNYLGAEEDNKCSCLPFGLLFGILSSYITLSTGLQNNLLRCVRIVTPM